MKRVLLLLAEGFEMIEAGAFIDVFGWNSSFGSVPVDLKLCGTAGVVRSAFGVEIKAELTIDCVCASDFDALAVPGGFGTYGFYADAHSHDFTGLIREFGRLNRPIASVCTGSIPLAKSGILNGRRATSYGLNAGKSLKRLERLGAVPVDERIVVDGGIITSQYPSTAFDTAFLLLKALTGTDNASHIRELMGFQAAGIKGL